jgi:hypothetical protein
MAKSYTAIPLWQNPIPLYRYGKILYRYSLTLIVVDIRFSTNYFSFKEYDFVAKSNSHHMKVSLFP